MTSGQRKRLISTVFNGITMKDRAIETATPCPDWEPYIAAALRVPSVGREGIEPPQPEAADLQSAELTTLLNLPENPAVTAQV